MTCTLLLVKETRANETRVALTPQDVGDLTSAGNTIFVEHNAGVSIGFSDEDYVTAGATIRYLNDETIASYQKLFADVTHIVRVKRPLRARELLENKAITQEVVMIGALDPLEYQSPHLNEYQERRINPHSIDQLSLSPDNPMNILSSMSKIAGRLALLDAINLYQKEIRKLVIIGFGTAGRSAFTEAMQLKLPVSVMLTNPDEAAEIKKLGASVQLLKKEDSITKQQNLIKHEIVNASIVITTARHNNKRAPILIPTKTLQAMEKGSIVVDLALSEGGNVAGSMHDATLKLGNEVIVTNKSNYPKAEPRAASILWSQATTLYLQQLCA